MRKNGNLNRALLERSCTWIREHWDAHNLDVPEHFLRLWMYPSDGDAEEPSAFHLAVFAFGYFQHDLIGNNVPPGVKRSVPASEVIERFHAWQMKLALAEIHWTTHLRTKPLPLFAFPDDEQIEAWQEPSDPPPRKLE